MISSFELSTGIALQFHRYLEFLRNSEIFYGGVGEKGDEQERQGGVDQEEGGRPEVREDGAHERVQFHVTSSVEGVGGVDVYDCEEERDGDERGDLPVFLDTVG